MPRQNCGLKAPRNCLVCWKAQNGSLRFPELDLAPAAFLLQPGLRFAPAIRPARTINRGWTPLTIEPCPRSGGRPPILSPPPSPPPGGGGAGGRARGPPSPLPPSPPPHHHTTTPLLAL